MKNESRANSESLQRPTTKKESESKKKTTSASKKDDGVGRVSTRKSSSKSDGSGKSDKAKSTNTKSKTAKQSSLEVSDSKSEEITSGGYNDTGPDNTKANPESKPEYLNITYSSVSKKLETSLVKFVSENKDTHHYVNLSFGSNSIVRILDSKESEYFINLDDEYMMVNLKENSVKNFGDIFECGIDTMMNIPWAIE